MKVASVAVLVLGSCCNLVHGARAHLDLLQQQPQQPQGLPNFTDPILEKQLDRVESSVKRTQAKADKALAEADHVEAEANETLAIRGLSNGAAACEQQQNESQCAGVAAGYCCVWANATCRSAVGSASCLEAAVNETAKAEAAAAQAYREAREAHRRAREEHRAYKNGTCMAMTVPKYDEICPTYDYIECIQSAPHCAWTPAGAPVAAPAAPPVAAPAAPPAPAPAVANGTCTVVTAPKYNEVCPNRGHMECVDMAPHCEWTPIADVNASAKENATTANANASAKENSTAADANSTAAILYVSAQKNTAVGDANASAKKNATAVDANATH